MGPRIREDTEGEGIRFAGIRYFLWWKRVLFSCADVSPICGHESGAGVNGWVVLLLLRMCVS